MQSSLTLREHELTGGSDHRAASLGGHQSDLSDGF
ncbi:unnamed protein product [Rhodiola kirilowii]